MDILSPSSLEQAVALHRAGRLAEAEAIYTRVLQAAPNHPDALHLLGVILEGRKEFERAAALVRASVQANPAFVPARETLLRVLRAAGQRDEAISVAQGIHGLKPDDAALCRSLAEMLVEAGRPAEAIPLYRRLLETAPRDADLLYRLGEALHDAADLDGAMDQYRRAIIERPTFPQAFERYTMARREQENAVRTASTLRRNAARPDGGGQGLCTIYIKGYSRPFYIDRLIRSIKRCVVNHGALVLLNDGIGPEYIAKLQANHPELDVRNSPKVEGGVIAAPANALYHERKQFYRTLDFFDPARFWVREIRKDTNDYIAFFDEDVWFYRELDMEGIITDLRANQALGALMLYQKNPALRQQRDPTVRQGDGGRGVVLDYYRAVVDSLDYAEGYRINPGNITLRDYWVNSYEDCLHFADEMNQNIKAIRFVTELKRRIDPVHMGIVNGGLLKHSSSSTARPDAGGKILAHRIAPDVFHDLLSNHWLEGRLDTMTDFPRDFSLETLVSLMRGHLPDEQVDAWIDWQKDFVRIYHWLD